MGWVFSDEMRFYLHENETLLEGMIRTQHRNVRYECQEGYCGSCRMRVIAKTGEIRYKQQPIAALEADEILACCCMASGTLCISYDSTNAQQLSLFVEKFIPQKTTNKKES